MESYEEKDQEAASDAAQLAEEGERVDKHIEEAKRDWEAKQGDSSVPGAVPGPGDGEGEPAEAESEHDEAADSAGQ